MKKLIWLFALLTFAYSATSTDMKSTSVDPYKKIKYFKLDNGLQVYLLSDEKAVNTQISLKVKVGYGVENDENYGITHLVEHMVFRDQRVPHHDYLDYIKDKGGTYVNGYTRRYETGYLATIDSNRSYWIAETFADMVFDKNVTDDDIRVEKGALQTEIGEFRWYHKLLWDIGKFFKTITPPDDDIFTQDFALKKEPELPAKYKAQLNNKEFTLPKLMAHYDKYYYPANMILTIVGNFDTDTMRHLIEKRYGAIKKRGREYAKKPAENPKLNHKPYRRFYNGLGENSAYIGAKYIIDDYKKYLILDIYSANLAERLQQHMRNKNGKTYSVNPYEFSDRKASVTAVTFDSLHGRFQENIDIVNKTILNDIKDLNDSTIDDALKSYEEKYYKSIEHDSASLVSLVDMAQYLREDHNITDKSSYDLFKSITHQEIRDTIAKVFKPENRYTLIYRDYYLFPMEMLVISLLSMILFFYIYIRVYRIGLKNQKILYTHRDVVMYRRVSNRLFGFWILLITAIISNIVWEWIKYIISDTIMDDPNYLTTLDVPYSYIATILDPIGYLILFVIIYYNFWRYYARIDITKEHIIAIGNRVIIIPKDKIESISVVPWRIGLYRSTIGSSLLFWKPLVEIGLSDGSRYYIRASQADHLREDLTKWLKEDRA
ncbi:FIG007959: peptidase, M16 family [hydrothermal vent metagenome]|uniref:FIG007959: peptidase, M16 family n=1 Tax=hydrothermal vent metagenome TaxID=652676 RepID=A0A1W1C4K5_9ZZZZ